MIDMHLNERYIGVFRKDGDVIGESIPLTVMAEDIYVIEILLHKDLITDDEKEQILIYFEEANFVVRLSDDNREDGEIEHHIAEKRIFRPNTIQHFDFILDPDQRLRQENNIDLHLYKRDFSEGYVRVQNSTDFIYIRDVVSRDNSYVFLGIRYDEEGNKLSDRAEYSIEQLNLNLPKLGMVNLGLFSYYTQRFPVRQWFRGLKQRLINVYPCVDIPERININDWPWTKMAANLFNKKYYSVEEAYNKVSSLERFSCAINRNFCIALAIQSPFPVLKYKRWNIGVFEKGVEVVLNKNAIHLSEEVNKYFEVKNDYNI